MGLQPMVHTNLAITGATSDSATASQNVVGATSISVQSKLTDATPSAVVVASASISPSTDLFTSTAHGLQTGLVVQVSTSNTLPAPLLVSTNYFVIAASANTFGLASSYANAVAGTLIDLTTAGTGNQTVTPTALTNAYIILEKSNVYEPTSTDWVVISQTAITATASVWQDVPFVANNIDYARFRIHITLDAGAVNAVNQTLIMGDWND